MRALEQKNKKKICIVIFRIISLIIIAICLFILFKWQKENNANKNLQNDLSNLIYTKVPDISNSLDVENNSVKKESNTQEKTTDILNFSVDFNSLLDKNSETVAWIRIENTNINYPIVQAKDNEYYLKHNFLREKNGAGWIFADYQNNFENLDKNTIIYGHNRRNGTMFSNLNYYLKTEWCKNKYNKYFNFITQNQSYIAEIFSVYKISTNNVDIRSTFSSQEEIQQNIDSWKSASIYDFQTEVTTEDIFLTLYTCDSNNSYRILIISKLTPLY